MDVHISNSIMIDVQVLLLDRALENYSSMNDIFTFGHCNFIFILIMSNDSHNRMEFDHTECASQEWPRSPGLGLVQAALVLSRRLELTA